MLPVLWRAAYCSPDRYTTPNTQVIQTPVNPVATRPPATYCTLWFTHLLCHALSRWTMPRLSSGCPSCGIAGMTRPNTALPTSVTLSFYTPMSTWEIHLAWWSRLWQTGEHWSQPLTENPPAVWLTPSNDHPVSLAHRAAGGGPDATQQR